MLVGCMLLTVTAVRVMLTCQLHQQLNAQLTAAAAAVPVPEMDADQHVHELSCYIHGMLFIRLHA